MSSQFTDIENSVEILGNKDENQVLICIHGGPGMDYSYFKPYLTPLSADMNLVYFNLGSIFKNHSIKSYIDELEAVMSLFKGKNINILGHSFGSAVLLEGCLKKKLYIDKIILCSWIHSNSFADFSNYKRLINYESQDFQRDTLDCLSQYFVEDFQEVGTKALEQVKYNGPAFSDLEFSYISKFDLTNLLKNISIPVMSIAGVIDKVVGIDHIKEGIRELKNVQSFEFEKSAHFPFIEENKLFLERVRDFVLDNNGGINETI